MYKNIVAFCIVCLHLVGAYVVNSVAPDNVPAFTIDFDEHPSTRYNDVFRYFREEIIEMENSVAYSIAPYYRELFNNHTDDVLISNPEAYYAMQSLSKITDLPLWQTLLVNALVDFYSYCVSIVAITCDGTIIHGRNHDVDNPVLFQPILHRIFILHGGKVIGEAASHAGFIGFYTAILYDAYSITYNTRMYPHNNSSDIISNIYREWTPNVLPVAQAIEVAILNNNEMSSASNYLKSEALVTPAYLILANAVPPETYIEGSEVGITITRDPYNLVHTDSLYFSAKSTCATIENHKWYLVQGNEDWWIKDDPDYLNAVSYMDKLGQDKISLETMITDVLTQTGVTSPYTSYSASMSARDKVMNIYLTEL